MSGLQPSLARELTGLGNIELVQKMPLSAINCANYGMRIYACTALASQIRNGMDLASQVVQLWILHYTGIEYIQAIFNENFETMCVRCPHEHRGPTLHLNLIESSKGCSTYVMPHVLSLVEYNARILQIIDMLIRREHGIFNRSSTNIDSLSQWCVGVLDL